MILPNHKKNDGSPITEADLKSNEIIKKILSQTSIMILSEEDKDDQSRLSEETIWIVDPLDGTSDFIDKTGEFTVMIALVKNKKPVLRSYWLAYRKNIFVAQKGKGHLDIQMMNGKKFQLQNRELSKCRTVGSRHHLSDKEKSFIKKLGIEDFTSIGSSLKVGKISSGES